MGKRKRAPVIFRCLECGHGFRTVAAAERAADRGCPKCGGVDIDLEGEREPSPEAVEWAIAEEYGGAFDGVTVTSDADPGL